MDYLVPSATIQPFTTTTSVSGQKQLGTPSLSNKHTISAELKSPALSTASPHNKISIVPSSAPSSAKYSGVRENDGDGNCTPSSCVVVKNQKCDGITEISGMASIKAACSDMCDTSTTMITSHVFSPHTVATSTLLAVDNRLSDTQKTCIDVDHPLPTPGTAQTSNSISDTATVHTAMASGPGAPVLSTSVLITKTLSGDDRALSKSLAQPTASLNDHNIPVHVSPSVANTPSAREQSISQPHALSEQRDSLRHPIGAKLVRTLPQTITPFSSTILLSTPTPSNSLAKARAPAAQIAPTLLAPPVIATHSSHSSPIFVTSIAAAVAGPRSSMPSAVPIPLKSQGHAFTLRMQSSSKQAGEQENETRTIIEQNGMQHSPIEAPPQGEAIDDIEYNEVGKVEKDKALADKEKAAKEEQEKLKADQGDTPSAVLISPRETKTAAGPSVVSEKITTADTKMARKGDAKEMRDAADESGEPSSNFTKRIKLQLSEDEQTVQAAQSKVNNDNNDDNIIRVIIVIC